METNGPRSSRFDVGLVVKNGMPHLPTALRSLEIQTHRNFRLIVQDGFSTDGTLNVLEAFKKRSAFEVEIVSEADSGVAEAYNRLIGRVKSPFLAYLDADNFYLPDHLEKALDFYGGNPDHAVYVSSHIMVGTDGKPSHYFGAPSPDFFGALLCHSRVPSGSAVYNMELVREELYYRTDLGHTPDYETWLRVLISGLKIHSSPEPTYCTRLSDASGSCDWERYPEYCLSMERGLDHFLKHCPQEALRAWIRNAGRGGIHAWAAYHLSNQPGMEEMAGRMERQAIAFYPAAPAYFGFGGLKSGQALPVDAIEKRFEGVREVLGIAPRPIASENWFKR
jgi:glycosyltransferase involved in cell wall biosynthesis